VTGPLSKYRNKVFCETCRKMPFVVLFLLFACIKRVCSFRYVQCMLTPARWTNWALRSDRAVPYFLVYLKWSVPIIIINPVTVLSQIFGNILRMGGQSIKRNLSSWCASCCVLQINKRDRFSVTTTTMISRFIYVSP
jgi:hypothetical protein